MQTLKENLLLFNSEHMPIKIILQIYDNALTLKSKYVIIQKKETFLQKDNCYEQDKSNNLPLLFSLC